MPTSFSGVMEVHNTLLPKHGKIVCRKCFSETGVVASYDSWTLRNDPGAWGSSTPKILILGFSKGATQSNIFEVGDFDNVAFGGKETRANLTRILARVGILGAHELVDEKIRNGETEFAFGSLVRCSLARRDFKTGRLQTSGALICRSFKEVPHIIANCTKAFLNDLPDSVELVILLGSSDSYIKNCRNVIRSLYPTDFQNINDVAYASGKVTWVHLTHPSRGNGTIRSWLAAYDSKIGDKREQAIWAIQVRHGGLK